MTSQQILKSRVREAQQDLTVAEDHYRENFTRKNYERMIARYRDLVAAREKLSGYRRQWGG